MVLNASDILLLVRFELTLKISPTHPCTTALSNTEVKSVFYTAHSDCRRTDMKTLTQKSLVCNGRHCMARGCRQGYGVHFSSRWSINQSHLHLVAFPVSGTLVLPSFSFCFWSFFVFVLNLDRYFGLSTLIRTNGVVLSCFQPYKKQ